MKNINFFFHWLERLHKYPTHPPLVLEFRSLCPMHLKTWEDNIPCGGEEYNVVQIKRSKRVRCFQCTIFEIFDGWIRELRFNCCLYKNWLVFLSNDKELLSEVYVINWNYLLKKKSTMPMRRKSRNTILGQ